VSKQKWLITGGAGYIGTHIADLFIEAGKDVVLLDSLYQGLESRVEYLRAKHAIEIPLEVIDIRDYAAVDALLAAHKFTGIVHTAALKAVGESMEKPDEYQEVNYTATVELLEAAKRHDVTRFIFSSTAAVYGSPDSMDPCREDGPTAPISPYGSSKLMAENKVTEFISIPGNHGSSLRFFNVVGSANKALLDNSVENLVPIVINRIKSGQAPVIYGNDYPTVDGTCVRDYVDVRDIAAAHLAIADATTALPATMNIGTGNGASVREIVQFVIDAMDRKEITPVDTDRRAGDPAFLCADVSLAKSAMGFTSRYSLKESVESLF
jgi:UDP-glucose 4-epimerase